MMIPGAVERRERTTVRTLEEVGLEHVINSAVVSVTFTSASIFCQLEFGVRTLALEAANSVGALVCAAAIVQFTFINVWDVEGIEKPTIKGLLNRITLDRKGINILQN